MRNRRAIERAEARLSEIFEGYSANVPHFAEALTEWGTKYRITKAMVHDWRAKTDTARIVRPGGSRRRRRNSAPPSNAIFNPSSKSTTNDD